MTSDKTGPLRIGTRGSRLALWQAEHVAMRLGGAELCIIKTSGDRFLDRELQGQDTKGFFTKEIEEALLDGRVDLAVHSLKDLPTELPSGLVLGAVPERAEVADWLLVRPDAYDPEAEFPLRQGGRVGASSLRRRALLHRYAHGLRTELLRGNVPTRIEKLKAGAFDAILLARAGIERLGLDLDGLMVFELDPERWLPAPGQAALGIEIRDDDEKTSRAVSVLHHRDSAEAVAIERELLARTGGGCHAAFGAWATPTHNGWRVLAGMEDENGDWRAASVSGRSSDECVRKMESALAQFSQTSIKETEPRTDKPLCRLVR